jgi:hypothetical protein
MRLADFSTNGSIHFTCMDWRHIRELLEAVTKPYSELKKFLCLVEDERRHGKPVPITA